MIPLLWICGPSGVGKTTTGWMFFELLTQAGIPTGYADIDQLGMCFSNPVSYDGHDLIKARNLAAAITNYEAAGAQCVVVSGVVDVHKGIPKELFPHARLTIVRLRASDNELSQRFLARGLYADQISAALSDAKILDSSTFADTVIDTTALPAADVTRQIRHELPTWPHPSPAPSPTSAPAPAPTSAPAPTPATATGPAFAPAPTFAPALVPAPASAPDSASAPAPTPATATEPALAPAPTSAPALVSVPAPAPTPATATGPAFAPAPTSAPALVSAPASASEPASASASGDCAVVSGGGLSGGVRGEGTEQSGRLGEDGARAGGGARGVRLGVGVMEVLWVCGVTGVGKSAVGYQVWTAIRRSEGMTGFVDLQQVGFLRPETAADPGNHQLKARNLAVLARTYHSLGAKRLVVVGPVEDRETIAAYAAELPGSTLTVCRLHAGEEELRQRILLRGQGRGPWIPGDWLKHLPEDRLHEIATTAAQQAVRLERTGIGDYALDTDGRSVEEVTGLVLAGRAQPHAVPSAGSAPSSR